jgi:putative transposase
MSGTGSSPENNEKRTEMMRNYKYLLRPSKKQDQMLDFLLWQERIIYNAALEKRIRMYQETGKSLNYISQWVFIRDLHRQHPDTFGLLNVNSLNRLLRRLDQAYAGFFRRVKAHDKKVGFPKFKSRRTFTSMEYVYGNGCKLRVREGRTRFYIQNVGEIRICYHRQVPTEAKIKCALIRRNSARWYVILMIELPDPQPEPRPPLAIGIDVGLKSILTCSNGLSVGNPHWLGASLVKLRILNRQASRRQDGSNRKKKTYAQVSRMYAKIANQRRDFYHKVTRNFVDNYSLIAIENLPMAFMNANEYLGKPSYDAGLATFRRFLEYKAQAAGVQVVAVSPYNTSQRCSGCGELVPKNLDTRIHACPYCGLVLDRDVNAAHNILQVALAQVNAQ